MLAKGAPNLLKILPIKPGKEKKFEICSACFNSIGITCFFDLLQWMFGEDDDLKELIERRGRPMPPSISELVECFTLLYDYDSGHVTHLVYQLIRNDVNAMNAFLVHFPSYLEDQEDTYQQDADNADYEDY